MNKGDYAVEEGDMAKALEEYASAEALMPESAEMKFWKAVTLANNDRSTEAIEILKGVYKDKNGSWKELLKRLPDVGLLEVSNEDFQLLLNADK
jgi:tetratricopeptide (TPR) repeat protein